MGTLASPGGSLQCGRGPSAVGGCPTFIPASPGAHRLYEERKASEGNWQVWRACPVSGALPPALFPEPPHHPHGHLRRRSWRGSGPRISRKLDLSKRRLLTSCPVLGVDLPPTIAPRGAVPRSQPGESEVWLGPSGQHVGLHPVRASVQTRDSGRWVCGHVPTRQPPRQASRVSSLAQCPCLPPVRSAPSLGSARRPPPHAPYSGCPRGAWTAHLPGAQAFPGSTAPLCHVPCVVLRFILLQMGNAIAPAVPPRFCGPSYWRNSRV